MQMLKHAGNLQQAAAETAIIPGVPCHKVVRGSPPRQIQMPLRQIQSISYTGKLTTVFRQTTKLSMNLTFLADVAAFQAGVQQTSVFNQFAIRNIDDSHNIDDPRQDAQNV